MALIAIRLVGLTSQFALSRHTIGQFGCSGLPPSDAKMKLVILKVKLQIFQLRTTFFNSWSNHTKLLNCDD